jgi:flagella synthesis protein FlgN
MSDLKTHLETERDALRAFAALLQTEQELLVAENVHRLQELAEQKSRAATQLAALIQNRLDALRSAGVSELGAWLADHAPDMLPVWHDIQQLSQQAQRLNSVNGELIQVRLRHNQQALAALNAAAGESAMLYGRDGQPNLPNSNKRVLGSG